MSLGLVGRKCGMTRIFAEDGASIPVTVVEVEPNRVTQVKSVESEVKVLPVALSAGTSKCKMLLTVTQFLTVRPVLLVNAKRQVAYLKVRKWLVTWVPDKSPCRV